MKIIPFFEGSFFTQQIALDGTVYVLDFHWNNRASAWSLTIRDVAQDILVAGIRLTIGTDLLAQFQSYDIPPGELYVFDLSGDFSDIGRDDFVNDRALQLVYFTGAEVV